MIRTLADPWLAQNAGRKYPLVDDAETDIPDNAVLDFRCTVRGVPADGAPYTEVGRIVNQGEVRKVLFDIYWGGAKQETLVFQIPLDLAPTGHYTVTASSARAFGTLTVTAVILSVASGNKGARAARTTVVVDGLGVDSVQGIPEADYSDEGAHHIDGNSAAVLSGALVLDPGANTDPYIDAGRIRLEISKGGGLGEWCQHPTATQTCNNVLFTINGERPGSDGDIRIVGDGGVTVKPVPDEHALEISIDRPASELMTKDCTAAC